jgi:transcriptional regulator with XRE-family HTH domain
MDNLVIFARRLRELREEKQLSIRDLSRILGVSHQSLSLLERCKTSPSFDTTIRLAWFFNVSADYLLGLDDRSTRQQSSAAWI